MNVTEARRTRHLVIRLDRGDELPAALVRALSEAEARAAWITGVGAIDAVELEVVDPKARGYATSRRIEAPLQVTALIGTAAFAGGALSLRLSTTLARETETGLETIAGDIAWARALTMELHVVVFDDLAFARVAEERSGLPTIDVLASGAGSAVSAAAQHAGGRASGELSPASKPVAVAAASGGPSAPRTASAFADRDASASAKATPVVTLTAAPHEPQPRPAMHEGSVAAKPTIAAAPVAHEMLQRPPRQLSEHDDMETYPDIGDLVTHFHFGECSVMLSDGDKIRLRQDRDGRVREVSLAALKIEMPTVTPDGKRHFHLTRKH